MSYYSEFDALKNHITRSGYDEIGRGCYGKVYARKDDNYVIKVSSRGDRGYTAFLQSILNNNLNKKTKGVPLIHKAWISGDSFCVYMERLVSIHDAPPEIGEKTIDNLSKVIKVLTGRTKIGGADDKSLFGTYGPLAPMYNAAGYLSKDIKGLGMDLHSGNVMYRPSSGEVVITDPVT